MGLLRISWQDGSSPGQFSGSRHTTLLGGGGSEGWSLGKAYWYELNLQYFSVMGSSGLSRVVEVLSLGCGSFTSASAAGSLS